MIKIINYKTAIDFLLPRHYSGRKPQIRWAFGYYENSVLKGVLTVGKPASNSLCKGICGEEFSDKVYELNRLCVEGNIKIPLSKFVSVCINRLKEHKIILVSYSDTDMNHFGTIYQATNWIYTGATKSRTDKFTEGNKHSRHYDKNSKEKLRKVRSSKHRYVYFCMPTKLKRYMIKQLNYPIKPYPKGTSSRYELGEFLKPKIC